MPLFFCSLQLLPEEEASIVSVPLTVEISSSLTAPPSSAGTE